MIQRVVQWVAKGEGASFFVNDTPKVIRDGNIDKPPVLYDPESHDDDNSSRATAETHACFVQEADLYRFSVIAGLQDLQATLLERLRTRYPVHVAEVTTLFSTLYTKGIYTPFDPHLIRFICKRVEIIKDPLLADDGLFAFLRTSFEAKDKLNALLRYANPDEKVIEQAANTISNEVGKLAEAKALLATFVEKYLKIPDPIPAAPTGPAGRRAKDNRTDDAMGIFQAIYRDNRLVVAEQSGHGVLHSTRSGGILSNVRHDDFRVSRGEILVMLPNEDPEPSASTSHVVCSRHGDVGELFEDLRLTPLQDVHGMCCPLDATFTVANIECQAKIGSTESARRAPLSPASESDRNASGKRKRTIDSWRPT